MKETTQRQEKQFLEKCRSIDGLYEEYAGRHSLTYISLTVLETMCENAENCTQKLIVEQTRYPKQSVNAVVQEFRRAGYITLEESEQDRRNKKIVFTRTGLAYTKKVISPLWKIDEAATELIPEADREIFIKCVETYERAFREQIEKITKR